eukprot:CAMPEP_0169149552 /NCGR_PEP_ID=MMETSP1015-20121227/49599_1 /TAXON_ID=342587 /ORGANISM="Karlodinium micrum, Strain CCMP2283" /LENGTH=186 /DNA_ID=CAMNT_0009218403 /DNA_START=151 /DNA_END=708 /DNA_ORIENTATION=+
MPVRPRTIGEAQTRKVCWADLQDSDDDTQNDQRSGKRSCREDIRSSCEDLETELPPALLHSETYMEKSKSFDEWAGCHFSNATALSKGDKRGNTVSCEPESDLVSRVATPSRNVSTTSVLGEADDEWPRRHEKRKRIVLSVKTSPEYGVMSSLMAEGKLETMPPSTPNAYDPDVSKRKWEESVKMW